VVNKYHPYARQQAGFAEIQFHLSKDPAAELTDPKQPLHLILGLTEAKLAFLKKHLKKDQAQVQKVTSRRVYFLAINHRKKLLQERDLRKGLAAAVNRKQILDQCFRGKDPAYPLLEATGVGLG